MLLRLQLGPVAMVVKTAGFAATTPHDYSTTTWVSQPSAMGAVVIQGVDSLCVCLPYRKVALPSLRVVWLASYLAGYVCLLYGFLPMRAGMASCMGSVGLRGVSS